MIKKYARKSRARRVLAADFEATTDPNDCRVWLWGFADIESPNKLEHGTTLQSFLATISKFHSTVYFHNLKYDGHFIIDYLLKHEYEHVDDKNLPRQSFTTLISDMGKFYSMTIHWGNGNRTEIRDSLKKLPMTLDRVAKSFGMEASKGTIDYHAHRPVGHVPTSEEMQYLRDDVGILATAIKETHAEGMIKLTVGSDALAEYKKLTGKFFDQTFPVLDEHTDADIRRAYRGGFTYADKRFSGRVVGSGLVLDVNSLYPSIMRNCAIPYGEPLRVEGMPKTSEAYPLSIFTVTFTAKLKPNHIPTIQIKNSFRFNGTEYLRNIDEPTTLSVTNVDWQLFNEHYDIDVWEYGGGYLFKATTGLFDSYIDKWAKIKENSTGGKREIAKLFLNSLYGKFATNPNVTSKYPVLAEDGSVKFMRGEDNTRPPIYTAAGVFITAYARDVTIRAAQANYDVFAYADTDSLHLLSDEIPEGIDVDPTRMGAWKLEYKFQKAHYVRAKVYLEQKHDGTYVNACAGLPDKASGALTFDDVKDGAIFHGKLSPKSVPGGIVLVEVPFTLNL